MTTSDVYKMRTHQLDSEACLECLILKVFLACIIIITVHFFQLSLVVYQDHPRDETSGVRALGDEASCDCYPRSGRFYFAQGETRLSVFEQAISLYILKRV